jgi:hypothetical protein
VAAGSWYEQRFLLKSIAIPDEQRGQKTRARKTTTSEHALEGRELARLVWFMPMDFQEITTGQNPLRGASTTVSIKQA